MAYAIMGPNSEMRFVHSFRMFL